MNDLISIIVPVYNVEKYLEECLESLINQTYKNLEIILVNDGSTDKSGEICDKYKNKDNRIVVIHKENGGLSSARNTGIEKAQGKYLSFVDSDDVCEEHFIEILYKMIIKYNVKISICGFKRFKNSFETSVDVNSCIDSDISVTECMNNILYQDRHNIFSVAACNKLYLKTIFETIKFPLGKLNEDMAVVLKILDECDKLAWTDYMGYGYRVNQKSITNQKFSEKRMDVIYVTEDMLEYVRNNHNELELAAENLLFRRNVEMLRKLMMSGVSEFRQEYNHIWGNIKKYRMKIIFDKKAKGSSRIAAIISFFGAKILVKIFSIYKAK